MRVIHSPFELATLIKNQRKKLKLSQAQVGDLVGLKQKTISAIENNPENITLNTLFRIVSALELDIKMTTRKESDKTKQWTEEW